MAGHSRLRKVIKWIAGIIFVLLVAFFYGVVPWFLTWAITTSRFHFPDPNDGKTPQSFGMADYHEIQFPASDGITLKGWYIPATAPAKGTIVYAHGQNRTRVEMLPMAGFAHTLGYNGVVFDLRHQGASGGNLSSIGYWERLDVEAAARYAVDEEHAAQPVVAWGVSMGAAAALMAAAEDPGIKAVISDSTFLNYKELVYHHYRLFFVHPKRRFVWWFPPLPAFPLATEVIYWSAWRNHFKPSDFDLEKAVRRINPRPILFVAVQGDERMPPWYAWKLYADSTSPAKAIVIVPGTKHGEGFQSGREQYEAAVTDFLKKLPAP